MIFFGGSHNPAFTNPTFLPEPPNPIFAHSSNMTLAPCFAASKAAEQPVKPPPTINRSVVWLLGVEKNLLSL